MRYFPRRIFSGINVLYFGVSDCLNADGGALCERVSQTVQKSVVRHALYFLSLLFLSSGSFFSFSDRAETDEQKQNGDADTDQNQ